MQILHIYYLVFSLSRSFNYMLPSVELPENPQNKRGLFAIIEILICLFLSSGALVQVASAWPSRARLRLRCPVRIIKMEVVA